MTRRLSALAAFALAGCSVLTAPREIIAAHTRDWRAAATDADQKRLREWRSSFVEALTKARASGHGAEIAAEGALLEPDAGMAEVPIPNGDYRCRVIKLGAKRAGTPDFVTYPPFQCRVRPEEGLQGFAKLTGSQRPIGIIFPSDSVRQVFLGTLVLGDESRAMQYGRDPDRDIAAFIEQVAPGRWRMLMPRPAFESTFDVIELVPVQ